MATGDVSDELLSGLVPEQDLSPGARLAWRIRLLERSREMTEHALRCRAHDIAACPRFAAHVADLTQGRAPTARIDDWT